MLNLPHLAARVFNVPLAIHPDKANEIVAVLRARFEGRGAAFDPVEVAKPQPRKTGGGIAVIPVLGTTVKRAGGMDAASGLTSYDDIRGDIQGALDSGASGIILDIDSPGGEVSGMFEFADWLGSIKSVPVYAVANDMAASAAYLVASATNKIYTSSTARVGSVGIYTMHLDQSEADAKEGLKYSFVYSGDHKVDGNPHEPLSDRKRAQMQSESDALYGMFVQRVAAFRGLTQEHVKGTQADTFTGMQAIKAGLADESGTLDDAIAAMTSQIQAGRAVMPLAANRISAVSADPKEKHMEAPTQADPQAAGIADVESALTKGKSAGLQHAAQILAACQIAGKTELAASFMEKGLSLGAVLTELQKAKADSDGPEISGHVSAETTGMPNATQKAQQNLLAAAKAQGDKERARMAAAVARRRSAGDYVGSEVN